MTSAHTAECERNNSQRLGRGELPSCVCGEGGGEDHVAGGEQVFPDPKMWETHHEPASAEEAFSRLMRFEKYHAMQKLLMELANAAPEDNHAMLFQPRARQILAGDHWQAQPTSPKSPALIAKERALDLEALAFAYRVVARLREEEPPPAWAAARITIEALALWEERRLRP